MLYKFSVNLQRNKQLVDMFSMKTKYALRALSRLSKEFGNGPLPISSIASTEGIPKRFLVNILQEMKTLGIVESMMGKNGGYLLTRHPSEISLLPIVQTCEQCIGLLDCVHEKDTGSCIFCKDIHNCKTRDLFLDIRDYTIRRLQETTLHNL